MKAQTARGPARTGRSRAIWRGLCPRCREGRIFRSLVKMNASCAVCELRFEREPGYFVGAMYVSYALMLPMFSTVTAVLWLGVVPTWSLYGVLALAVLVFLPAAPFVFRHARIIWIHLERAIDP